MKKKQNNKLSLRSIKSAQVTGGDRRRFVSVFSVDLFCTMWWKIVVVFVILCFCLCSEKSVAQKILQRSTTTLIKMDRKPQKETSRVLSDVCCAFLGSKNIHANEFPHQRQIPPPPPSCVCSVTSKQHLWQQGLNLDGVHWNVSLGLRLHHSKDAGDSALLNAPRGEIKGAHGNVA